MKSIHLLTLLALFTAGVSLNVQAHEHHHHRHHGYSQPYVEYQSHRYNHHHHRHHQPRVEYHNNWVAPVAAGIVISAPVVGLPVISAPRYTSHDPRYINYPVPAAPPQDALYCRYPDGFYPAIRSCPGGWERVRNYR